MKIMSLANRRYFAATKLQNNWCGYYDKAIYFGATSYKTGMWIIRLIMRQLSSVKAATGIPGKTARNYDNWTGVLKKLICDTTGAVAEWRSA